MRVMGITGEISIPMETKPNSALITSLAINFGRYMGLEKQVRIPLLWLDDFT